MAIDPHDPNSEAGILSAGDPGPFLTLTLSERLLALDTRPFPSKLKKKKKKVAIGLGSDPGK